MMGTRQEPEDPKVTKEWEELKKGRRRESNQEKEDKKDTKEWEEQKGKE
jgi:hypothetical protein